MADGTLFLNHSVQLAIAVCRAVYIYPLTFLLNLGRTNKIPIAFQHVLFFSGEAFIKNLFGVLFIHFNTLLVNRNQGPVVQLMRLGLKMYMMMNSRNASAYVHNKEGMALILTNIYYIPVWYLYLHMLGARCKYSFLHLYFLGFLVSATSTSKV